MSNGVHPVLSVLDADVSFSQSLKRFKARFDRGTTAACAALVGLLHESLLSRSQRLAAFYVLWGTWASATSAPINPHLPVLLTAAEKVDGAHQSCVERNLVRMLLSPAGEPQRRSLANATPRELLLARQQRSDACTCAHDQSALPIDLYSLRSDWEEKFLFQGSPSEASGASGSNDADGESFALQGLGLPLPPHVGDARRASYSHAFIDGHDASDTSIASAFIGTSLAAAVVDLQPVVDPLQALELQQRGEEGALVSDRLLSLLKRFTGAAEGDSVRQFLHTVAGAGNEPGSTHAAASATASSRSSANTAPSLSCAVSSAQSQSIVGDSQLSLPARELLAVLTGLCSVSASTQSALDSLPALVASTPSALLELADVSLSPQPLLVQLIERCPQGAVEVLRGLLQVASDTTSGVALLPLDYLQALLDMPASLQTLEVVNRLLLTGCALPPDFLRLFIVNALETCTGPLMHDDRPSQVRLVRLVCVFLSSLLSQRAVAPGSLFLEVQAFCIEFGRIKEAAALFRQLKMSDDSEGDEGG